MFLIVSMKCSKPINDFSCILISGHHDEVSSYYNTILYLQFKYLEEATLRIIL